MKDKSVKKVIIKELGDFAVFLGGKAVGKCMVPGLFDPKCKWRPTPATFADLNGRFAEPNGHHGLMQFRVQSNTQDCLAILDFKGFCESRGDFVPAQPLLLTRKTTLEYPAVVHRISGRQEAQIARMPSNAIILRCEWLVSKELFQLPHKNPILAFKPVLIGCQYGLFVVHFYLMSSLNASTSISLSSREGTFAQI